ncbi:hypothetical protein PCI56_13080 [Plesiomonas shigelloides subsp. oncorhynchi]|nr:hypothetical protein [Plesiomonas shigelloides]
MMNLTKQTALLLMLLLSLSLCSKLKELRTKLAAGGSRQISGSSEQAKQKPLSLCSPSCSAADGVAEKWQQKLIVLE